jgi:hypothetical protein
MLNEKPRKYNTLIVRWFQHSRTALEVLMLTVKRAERFSHLCGRRYITDTS